MRTLVPLLAALPALLLGGCAATRSPAYDPAADSLRYTGEAHLRNVRQLTFGGNNAEAYWSFDGERLIFQSDWAAINPQGCDQQFVMRADGTDVQQLTDNQWEEGTPAWRPRR